jgi:hypothetical protein
MMANGLSALYSRCRYSLRVSPSLLPKSLSAGASPPLPAGGTPAIVMSRCVTSPSCTQSSPRASATARDRVCVVPLQRHVACVGSHWVTHNCTPYSES